MTQERDAIVYARETTVAAAEFQRVLQSSGLGRIRPVSDPARLQRMLDQADLVVTARRAGELVGLARSVTDFSWACYLADLAVSQDAQRFGVGRGLLEQTRRELGPEVALILASVPEAVGFYQRAGMESLPDCFWFRRQV
jgi:ribosomal protein S18 acetylase RimI-like enzyme